MSVVATTQGSLRLEAACRCSHSLGTHKRLPWDATGYGAGPSYGPCSDPICACGRWEFECFREVAR
jgi:hypothetical protein